MEPRCAIEGRLKAKLAEMRDARLGVAAVPAQRLSKVDLWLLDIGCGHLVSREHATKMKRWILQAAEPIQFSTAN
eukprot:4756644-Alexandrium_andersonii.AAC.1